MKRTLDSLVLVAAFVAFAAWPLAAAEKPPRVVCEGRQPHHLQGVATDGTNLYWSFTTVLVKTDFAGRVSSTNAIDISQGHMGDLCFKGGRLYVGMNFGKDGTGARKGDAIWEYDASNLARVAGHPTPEPAWCNNGLEWYGGSFWVITSAPRHSEYNYLYEYTPDFRYRTCVLVKSGWTNLGVQTICRAGDALLLGCYGSSKDTEQPHKDSTLRVDGKRLISAAHGRKTGPVAVDWRREVGTSEAMFVLNGTVWEGHSVLLSCAKDGCKTWTAQAFPSAGLQDVFECETETKGGK